MLRLTGLLEMMFDVLSAWVDDFLLDIDQLESDSPSDTPGSAPGSAQVSPRSLVAHSPIHSELFDGSLLDSVWLGVIWHTDATMSKANGPLGAWMAGTCPLKIYTDSQKYRQYHSSTRMMPKSFCADLLTLTMQDAFTLRLLKVYCARLVQMLCDLMQLCMLSFPICLISFAGDFATDKLDS